MKPGDLIRINKNQVVLGSKYLCEVPNSNTHKIAGLIFPEDVGTVLELREQHGSAYPELWVKVLVKDKIGWIMRGGIEVIL